MARITAKRIYDLVRTYVEADEDPDLAGAIEFVESLTGRLDAKDSALIEASFEDLGPDGDGDKYGMGGDEDEDVDDGDDEDDEGDDEDDEDGEDGDEDGEDEEDEGAAYHKGHHHDIEGKCVNEDGDPIVFASRKVGGPCCGSCAHDGECEKK